MSVTFKHSGHLGDIVYALPAMRTIARQCGVRVTLYIPNDVDSGYGPERRHPAGDKMIDDATFDFVAPLLRSQAYIEAVHFVPGNEIPCDAVNFDAFRGGSVNVLAGNIKDYYFKIFALLAESPSRWLKRSGAVHSYAKPYDILIGRSMRYLNQAIDYGVLAQLDLRIGFIGLESEFTEFRSRFPSLPIEHVPTRHAQDACDRIAEASLFIGNQSVFFAIAEGLQSNRLLEVFEPVPNVVPSGGRTGQFLTTAGLARLVSAFFSRTITLPDPDAALRSEYMH